MMFRATRQPAYLAQAHRIAGFYMQHPRLPADKVPYWDFDAPAIPPAPRDTSAAAIASAALLELATFSDAPTAARYRDFAEQALRSLSSPLTWPHPARTAASCSSMRPAISRPARKSMFPSIMPTTTFWRHYCV
jgi:hypothetical protein